MIVIYPDTNPFYADHLMRREVSENFLNTLSRGAVEVRLSPVVVAESARQLRESAERLTDEITGALDNARRAFVLEDDQVTPLAAEVTRRLAQQSADALRPLLDHDACTVIDWSEVSARSLVERELDRRKPVLEKSNGHLRDTVIWHGLLEVAARLGADDYLVFVTQDKGFTDGDALHASLADEVAEVSDLPAENFSVVPNLSAVTHEVRRISNQVDEREEVLLNAFSEFVGNLTDYDWEGGPSSTDLVDRPSLPDGMRGVELDVAPFLDIYLFRDGNPATCIGFNELVFRGTMSTFDFMRVHDDRMSMLGGPVHGNDVAVEFRVQAQIEAEIEYDPGLVGVAVISGSVTWVD